MGEEKNPFRELVEKVRKTARETVEDEKTIDNKFNELIVKLTEALCSCMLSKDFEVAYTNVISETGNFNYVFKYSGDGIAVLLRDGDGNGNIRMNAWVVKEGSKAKAYVSNYMSLTEKIELLNHLPFILDSLQKKLGEHDRELKKVISALDKAIASIPQ